MVDVFHAVFGVADLSLLRYPGLDDLDPVYCMPASLIEGLGLKKGRRYRGVRHEGHQVGSHLAYSSKLAEYSFSDQEVAPDVVSSPCITLSWPRIGMEA